MDLSEAKKLIMGQPKKEDFGGGEAPSVLAKYDGVSIYSGFPLNRYEFDFPRLNDTEKNVLSLVRQALISTLGGKKISSDSEKGRGLLASFDEKISPLLKYRSEFFLKPFPRADSGISEFVDSLGLTGVDKNRLVLSIRNYLFGVGLVTGLLEDNNLEEIMVNGPGEKTFVYHKNHGMCKTNLVLDSSELLDVVRLTSLALKRPVSVDNPFLDARLSENSRINATVPPASPVGATMTIRKLKKVPLSVVDLIGFGTLTPDLAAFLWLSVEGMQIAPLNIIIAGGTASGKTTLLNTLSMFVPHSQRVVSIEDTLELNLGNHENWVKLEAKTGLSGDKDISMNDLVKNSLRMRPDRILLGEVRDEAAQSLFFAMNTGHAGSMATLHANNSRETVKRLTSKPMEVPPSQLSVLDLIVVENRTLTPDGMRRRVVQVSELSGFEGEKPLMSDVFSYDRARDVLARTSVPSSALEKMSQNVGLSKPKLKDELEVRRKLIDFMVKRGVRKLSEVELFIQGFYEDPAHVIKMVLED